MSILLEEIGDKQVWHDWNDYRSDEGQEGNKVGAVTGADGTHCYKVNRQGRAPGEQGRAGWEETQRLCCSPFDAGSMSGLTYLDAA